MTEESPSQELYNKLQAAKGDIDVLCIGELLTDYISKEDKPLKEVTVFDKFLGGSPANIVFHLKHLDNQPVLITKIGDDEDGKFLLDTLKKYNVIDSYVLIGTKGTSRSLIGKRVAEGTETHENIILRGADTELHIEEIDEEVINNSKIIHANAFSLSEEPTRSTIMEVLQKASKIGKIISFDPNFREHVWPNKDEALEVLSQVYPFVDITKPSMDDAASLYGNLEPEEYIKRFHLLGAKFVILTMGSDGSLISNGRAMMRVQAAPCDAKDATGAGDLYWAVFLKCLLEGYNLRECGEQASFAAAKAVQKTGAILTEEEYRAILAHLNKNPPSGKSA